MSLSVSVHLLFLFVYTYFGSPDILPFPISISSQTAFSKFHQTFQLHPWWLPAVFSFQFPVTEIIAFNRLILVTEPEENHVSDHRKAEFVNVLTVIPFCICPFSHSVLWCSFHTLHTLFSPLHSSGCQVWSKQTQAEVFPVESIQQKLCALHANLPNSTDAE